MTVVPGDRPERSLSAWVQSARWPGVRCMATGVVALPSVTTWSLVVNPAHLPWLAIPTGAGSMLVNPDTRGINHQGLRTGRRITIGIIVIIPTGQGQKILHDPGPGAVPAPPVVLIEAGRVRTVALGKVTPRYPRAENKEYAVHDLTVILSYRTGPASGQDLLEKLLLHICQFMTPARHQNLLCVYLSA